MVTPKAAGMEKVMGEERSQACQSMKGGCSEEFLLIEGDFLRLLSPAVPSGSLARCLLGCPGPWAWGRKQIPGAGSHFSVPWTHDMLTLDHAASQLQLLLGQPGESPQHCLPDSLYY